MKKEQIETLETDDEVLREKAMESGKQSINGIDYHPTDCLRVSWMQRNNVMDDSKMDIVWRVFAFAVIHTMEKKQLRSIVNDSELFIEAVDSWMEKHNPSEGDFKTISALMNERILEWFSSSSSPKETGSANPGGN
jgi:fructose-1,6-bisphosphatase